MSPYPLCYRICNKASIVVWGPGEYVLALKQMYVLSTPTSLFSAVYSRGYSVLKDNPGVRAEGEGQKWRSSCLDACKDQYVSSLADPASSFKGNTWRFVHMAGMSSGVTSYFRITTSLGFLGTHDPLSQKGKTVSQQTKAFTRSSSDRLSVNLPQRWSILQWYYCGDCSL